MNENEILDELWVEKYRPTELDDFVLQKDVKSKIKSWMNDGIYPHLILYGVYGTGKTSIVKFLIDKFDTDVLEINASKNKGIDLMRDQVTSFLNVGSFSKFKTVVFHEGEQLTPRAQEALKEDIEINSDDTRVIFTTNHVERINGAISSRCTQLHIEPPSPKSVAKRVQHIISAEGIKVGDDQKGLLWKLVKQEFPDIRGTIKKLQDNTYDGELRLNKNTDEKDFNFIIDRLDSVNEDNKVEMWNEMRGHLNKMSYNSLKNIYAFLYSNLNDIYNNEQYYLSVSVIAEYDYKSSFDVDIEINISALIKELIQIKIT